jgi:hypothetical protein
MLAYGVSLIAYCEQEFSSCFSNLHIVYTHCSDFRQKVNFRRGNMLKPSHFFLTPLVLAISVKSISVVSSVGEEVCSYNEIIRICSDSEQIVQIEIQVLMDRQSFQYVIVS